MKRLFYPGSYAARHALSVGLAVLTAVFANHSLSYTQSGWVILSALLVSQTTRGTPFRQGISFFLVLLIAILFALMLQLYLPLWPRQIAIICLFVLGGYQLARRQWQTSNAFYFLTFFILMTLFALFTPSAAPESIRYQIADVMIGAFIGVSFGALVFPVKLNKEFYLALLPVLTALIDYAHTFETVFAKSGENNRLLVEKRHALEDILQNSHLMYPEWVYEGGFNPGLRSGFRFFLVHLERVTELFIAMDGLITRGLDRALLTELSFSLIEVMKKNQVLLSVLHRYFATQTLEAVQEDYTADIAELEDKLRQCVPQKLELLDLSQDYVEATALVRDIKDMRELLLKLAIALPPFETAAARPM